MRSPDWSSTAIFLAWDDWGGFYDHVRAAGASTRTGYGLRVPALVISPYAKRGYIDHQVLSFDAYLKFIEDDFLHGQRLDPKTDGRPGPAAGRAREREDPRRPREGLRFRAGAAAPAPLAAASEVRGEYSAADGCAGDEGSGARARRRVARVRRQRRRAPRRLRRLRAPRPAGRPRARARDEGEALARGGARDRGRPARAAAGRGAVRALPRVRRLPLPGSRRTSAQLAQKQSQVRDAFQRLAGIAEPPLEEIVPCEPEIFHYRNKMEYSFTRADEGPALGLHRAGRWDEVLDIRQVLADDRCRQRPSRRGPRLGARGRARRRTRRRTAAATCGTSSSARAATPVRRSCSS